MTLSLRNVRDTFLKFSLISALTFLSKKVLVEKVSNKGKKKRAECTVESCKLAGIFKNVREELLAILEWS